MPIAQAVVHDPARPAALDGTPLTQETQLVAERGLAQAEQPGEVAHAQLVGKAQRVEDPGARGIGKEIEGRDHVLGLTPTNHASDEWADVLRVEALDLTLFERRLPHMTHCSYILPEHVEAVLDRERARRFRVRPNDEEIAAVLAYIKTMWTPEQRESQESATRQQC